MISKIHGILESMTDGRAQMILDGGLTYEVLLPAFVSGRLGASVGTPVTLHTIHYLEGSSQGNNFTPRLAGFTGETDREFFELFTSVKGIGPRKALRAMAMTTGRIAAAIADRDVRTLQSLPEIGKRTAETIVAALHGRVDRFVSADAYGETEPAASGAAGPAGDAAARSPSGSAAREALEVLLQLGENRVQAVRWIDEVLIRQPDLRDSQQLISEVLRMKGGG